MAKHRRSTLSLARYLSGNRSATFRAGALVIVLAVCGFAGVRLWSSTRNAPGPQRTARALASPRASSAPRYGSGGTTPAPAGSGASAAASPSRSPSQTPVLIPGSAITAIGDSIMVASTPALDHALPGIAIDAAVSRQFSTGLQVLAGLRATGQLRSVVIFALGTNGEVTASEISQLFAEIGPNRRLVLVNTYEARPWEHQVNAILAAAVRSHRGVVLANWHETISHHTNLLWPDGIHPQPAGGVLYARMIKSALGRLTSPPR